MRTRATCRVAATAAAAMLVGGCYVYHPAAVTEVRPDSRVRLTVSAQQAAELETALRDTRRTFTATYLGRDDGQLFFAVPLLNPAPGTATRSVHNRIAVPSGEVTGLERRALSRWRTAAAVGAGALALGFAGWEAFGGGRNERTEDKPPDVDAIRVPLFSIPFGW